MYRANGGEIGMKYNFDDVFFRDLTICTLATLENKIKWKNRFTDVDVDVNVPIYYSITGGNTERFLLDSFTDDIVGDERFTELDTTIIPKGILTLSSISIKSDEFANSNVFVPIAVENEKEIRKLPLKIRPIPIDVTYDLEIVVDSEIDLFKCTQAMINTLWLYNHMYFEYNLMNIDAMLIFPDSTSFEIERNITMDTKHNIKIKVALEVSTYYPAFNYDKIYGEGDNEYYRNGEYFQNSDGVVSQTDVEHTDEPITYPKRTHWFENLRSIHDLNVQKRKNISENEWER